jgi:hypothetical protein
MLRGSFGVLSRSLHSNSLVAHASLELMKLHLRHAEAIRKSPKGVPSNESREIEIAFLNQLDEVRALFRMGDCLEVAKMYSQRIIAALRHFRLGDDPLMTQLEMILGKHRLHSRRANVFKVASTASYPPNVNDLQEKTVFNFPSELPNPPRRSEELPREALRLPDSHRGHWVLRDPEIALSRQQRREDPW